MAQAFRKGALARWSRAGGSGAGRIGERFERPIRREDGDRAPKRGAEPPAG